MKTVQTYLTLTILLICGTLFSQENTSIRDKKEISDHLTSISNDHMTEENNKKDNQPISFKYKNTQQYIASSAIPSDKKSEETRRMVKATLEISETSVPRTTIDFF